MAIVHSPIQPVIESVFSSPTQPRLSFFDPDAGDYFKRIMAAGSSISANNKVAVAEFIIGCKADGIWDAIKASCILAAADTLAGALVPLKGAAPTNGNFEAGDYSRTTGLKGNGSTKYLNSNRNNNADPRNDNHHAVRVTTAQSPSATPTVYMDGGGTVNGANNIGRAAIPGAASVFLRNRVDTFDTVAVGAATGLVGTNRSVSASYVFRGAGANTTVTRESQTPAIADVFVFSRGGTTLFTDARLSFYSIGESLNLAQLDARLTTLMAAIT